MKQYVVIGNGVAAAGCIEGIRSVDPQTPITVISKENYPDIDINGHAVSVQVSPVTVA